MWGAVWDSVPSPHAHGLGSSGATLAWQRTCRPRHRARAAAGRSRWLSPLGAIIALQRPGKEASASGRSSPGSRQAPGARLRLHSPLGPGRGRNCRFSNELWAGAGSPRLREEGRPVMEVQTPLAGSSLVPAGRCGGRSRSWKRNLESGHPRGQGWDGDGERGCSAPPEHPQPAPRGRTTPAPAAPPATVPVGPVVLRADLLASRPRTDPRARGAPTSCPGGAAARLADAVLGSRLLLLPGCCRASSRRVQMGILCRAVPPQPVGGKEGELGGGRQSCSSGRRSPVNLSQ